MGGSKAKKQNAAQATSAAAAEAERQKAAGLQNQLEQRRSIVTPGLQDTLSSTRTGAEDLRNTGGYGDTLKPVQDAYSNMAVTGGFNPGEKEQFLRRATAPVAAVFSRTRDELQRQKSLQGGYMPGFSASNSRLTRTAAQTGADVSLNANVELANQVRTGKLTGTQGQERVAGMVQQGKVAGQDALERYSQFGIAALSDIDQNELRNRLQTGQLSQADAQLLASLAAQDKTTFDKIMQGVGAIGGAAAGVITGVGSLGNPGKV